MTKTLFDERLVDREHGSALLHVGSVLAWAKSKGLHLNQTQPIDGYEFVQAECLVVALARQAEDLTPEQAREIVLADPVLKNNPRFLKYPNDIDPVFCKWLLGGDANVRWRAVLNSAIAAHELVLLDFGSKLPIAAAPVQIAEASASVVVASARKAVPAQAPWQLLVQAEATELFLRLLAAGTNPTTHSIIPSMAKWCRDNNIKTDGKNGGINPSEGYLRAHVLAGKHWRPPNVSRDQAKKHVAQIAQMKVAQVAQ